MTKAEKLILELQKEFEKRNMTSILLAIDKTKENCHLLITPKNSKTLELDLVNLVTNCISEDEDPLCLEFFSAIFNSILIYLSDNPKLIPNVIAQLQEIMIDEKKEKDLSVN